MGKVIIADASCLIVCTKLDALQLLQQIFGQIIITPEVQQEFGLPLPEFIDVKSVRNQDTQQVLRSIIDTGEASVIALALDQPQSLLMIDERKGRKVALQMGLSIIGTLGVLLLAKQKGLIPAIKPYLQQLQKSGFHMSEILIKEILDQADEE